MPVIRTGDLRRKVLFKEPTSSLNDEQGIELSYDPPASTLNPWAAIRNIDVRRITEANQTFLVGAKDFYIRWSNAAEAITKDWLIEYKNQDWVIAEIEQINEEDRFIRFTAKTRSNG